MAFLSCFIASQLARDVGPHGDDWECWEDLQCHWMEGEFPHATPHCVPIPIPLLQGVGPIAIAQHWGHGCRTLSFEPQGLKVPKLLYDSPVWKIQLSQCRQIKGSPSRYLETYHFPPPILATGGLDCGTQPAAAAPPYCAPKLSVPLCHNCPGKAALCNWPCNTQTPEAGAREGPSAHG